MWEPVAFCCFTRRVGCLVLASMNLIASIVLLVPGLFILVTANTPVLSNYVCRESFGGKDCPPDVITGVTISLSILVFVCVWNLVCDSLLIHGIRKRSSSHMCPFLITNTVYLVLEIIGASVILVILSAVNFWIMIPLAKFYVAQVFMHTYFLLCVRAYYYEIKRSIGDDRSKLVENVEM